VFGLVTTLKTCLTHPIAQSVPLHLRAALDITRAAHAGLGILNVNFRDTRRTGNTVGLVPGHPTPRLAIRYAPAREERTWLQPALRRVRAALRALGCLVPPGFAYVRPMGASAHYAGLVPMAQEGGPGTATPEGRSRDFANLWLADGITFPFLPAKNLTFTLMANAVRVASAEF
jgi:choline dehydrogenase-like flavoprotein